MNISSNTEKSKTNRKLPTVLIILILVIVVGASLAVVLTYQARNYAAEVASQLENSLADVGGVKKCSRSAPGRGPDNYEPRYSAIYEIPGDREEATKLSLDAFKKEGYDLKVGNEPPSPEDNKFYNDKTSKQSPYSDLAEGKIDLNLVVFGSSTHTGEGDQFCTITKREHPPTDKTTINFVVNMPAFKGK